MIVAPPPARPSASDVFDSTMRHYAKASRGYRRRSAGFPWSILKDREARAVMRAVGPVEGAVTLDLGCGIGYFTEALLDAGARRVFAVDACEPMLRQVPSSAAVTTVLSDALSVTLPAPVDAAICAGMLEFVEDPVPVLARALDLVVAGGLLAVLVPSDGVWARLYRRYHKRHGIDVRLYNRHSLALRLAAAGWEVQALQEIGPMALVARARSPV